MIKLFYKFWFERIRDLKMLVFVLVLIGVDVNYINVLRSLFLYGF